MFQVNIYATQVKAVVTQKKAYMFDKKQFFLRNHLLLGHTLM